MIKGITKNIQTKDPIRVMVIDPVTITRGFIAKILSEDKELSLLASFSNLKPGLDILDKKDIEVLLLDSDILNETTLKELALYIKKQPDLQIILTSNYKKTADNISVEAMEIGIIDFLLKPLSTKIIGDLEFKRELKEKIKYCGELKRKKVLETHKNFISSLQKKKNYDPTEINITSVKKTDTFSLKIIAIGSSTGGPQAVAKILNDLSDFKIEQPILITQHMPAMFTGMFADHLKKISGRDVLEAKMDMEVRNSSIYIAPGGKHMTLERRASDKKVIIKLLDTPPENFCKPSIEPMIRGIIDCYGGDVLEIILTGMGNDGHKTAKDIIDAGGQVIVQDKETSVIWGMPGVIAREGHCTAILPLDKIALYIKKMIEEDKK